MSLANDEIQLSPQELEMIILGCMLNSQEHHQIVLSLVKECYFEDKKHRVIFRAIKETLETENAVDIILVGGRLKNNGCFETVEGLAYLATLSQFAGTAAHIEAYCKNLHELSVKRSLSNIGRDLIGDLEKGIAPYAALERVSTKIENIKAEKPRADSLYSHLLTPTSEKEISNEIKDISPGADVRMKIGEIDLKIPGGAITIFALPTGHGKTLLLINSILNFLSHNQDKKAYFFSFEESRAAIISLFLNTYIDMELSKNNRESIKSCLKDGQPTYVSHDKKDEFERKKDEFFRSLIDTGRLNIFYCDYYAEELVEAIKFINNNTAVGLVGVDYMQLLRSINKKTIQRQEELKQICLMIKDCAVETGLPIILAAQFNRSVINEATISPVAIGEAGDIERVANLIVGGWNRNYEGFSEDGNIGKDKKRIPKASAIYLEILKGRETGIGHASVLELNGNTGKLTPPLKKESPSTSLKSITSNTVEDLWG